MPATESITLDFGAAAGASEDHLLLVSQVHQHQPLWCWAACAEMVLDFYGDPIVQCEVANLLPDLDGCCDDEASCNRACTLDEVTFVYTERGLTTSFFDKIPFADLTKYLVDGRPLEILYEVGYLDGKRLGHLAVIVGYRILEDDDEWVAIRDPLSVVSAPPKWIRYAALQNGYDPMGDWIHSWLFEKVP